MWRDHGGFASLFKIITRKMIFSDTQIVTLY